MPSNVGYIQIIQRQFKSNSMTKKTKTPRTGRKKKPGAEKLVGRSVSLHPNQWAELKKTGNINLTVRKVLSENGYPEKPITT